MKVQEIMSSRLVVVDANENVQQAAERMAKEPIGALPVVDDGKVVGILTDRDIVTRSVATGVPPEKTAVRTVMTDSVVGVAADEEIESAAAVMKAQKVRRLMVAAGGRAAGIVSLGDLAVNGNNPSLTHEVLEMVSYPAEPRKR